MTYEEAIKVLTDTRVMILKGSGTDLEKACSMAIEALEKQIPKKPIYSNYDDNGFDKIIPYRAECPACEESVEFGKWNAEESHHCECGQALDWSE